MYLYSETVYFVAKVSITWYGMKVFIMCRKC